MTLKEQPILKSNAVVMTSTRVRVNPITRMPSGYTVLNIPIDDVEPVVVNDRRLLTTLFYLTGQFIKHEKRKRYIAARMYDRAHQAVSRYRVPEEQYLGYLSKCVKGWISNIIHEENGLTHKSDTNYTFAFYEFREATGKDSIQTEEDLEIAKEIVRRRKGKRTRNVRTMTAYRWIERGFNNDRKLNEVLIGDMATLDALALNEEGYIKGKRERAARKSNDYEE